MAVAGFLFYPGARGPQRTLCPFFISRRKVFYVSKGFKIQPRTDIIELSGDWLGVEFTARTDLKIKEVRNVQAGLDGSIELLTTIIRGWNLTSEDDAPIPITAEAMEELPVKLVDEMVTAYMKKVQAVSPN